MQFPNPLALLYLPVIAAVLLLARRTLVRVRRPVGALFLWQAVDPFNPRAAMRMNLRRRLLVFVQAALALALTLALARPTVTTAHARAAFLIDVSASMGARDGNGTRLALARRAALDAAQSLPAGTRIDVWTTDPLAAVSKDTDAAGLATSLAKLTTSDGAADLSGAIATIRAAGTGGAAAPMFVFSDSPAVDADMQVRWTTVGTSMPNVAITSLVGRQLNSPEPITEIVVGVRNYGPAGVDVPFELDRGLATMATDTVRVPAREMMTATVRLPRLTGAVRAHLSTRDALDTDNARFAWLSEPSHHRALLITNGNFFLERALRSTSLSSVDVVRPGRAWPREHYDVVVCDGCTTIPGTAPALLLPPTLSASATPKSVHVVATGHPLARFVQSSEADAIPIPGALPSQNTTVVARAGETPVVLATESAGRRTVELRMDVRESPLVFSPAFPILISNAVAWLVHDGENPNSVAAGQPLRWTIPPARSVSVVGPDDVRVPASVNGERLSIAALSRAGVYDVQLDDRHETFVVNPATDSESDLTVRSVPGASRPPLAFASTSEATSITVPLLIAALLLLAAEVLLAVPASKGAWMLRLAIGLAVAVAAAAPRIPLGVAREDVLFLLDRSASVSGRAESQALSTINRLAQTARTGDRAGLIVFGQDAAVERELTSGLRVSTVTSRTASAGTNIEAALRAARQQRLTGLRRAVLLSDGHQTAGDALGEAARAAADGLPVDVIAIDSARDAAGGWVRNLNAPALVRAGEPFIVSADLQGKTGLRVEVELRRDDVVVAIRPAVFREDGSARVEFSDSHRAPGMHTYTALVRSVDEPAGLPEAGAVVTVAGQPALLYVAAGARTLEGTFTASQWQVRTSLPDKLPAAASALNGYDGVVLEDVNVDRLTSAQASALIDYVQNDGGGLVILGGAGTLASFQASALGRILPVDVRPRHGTRGPAMALVLAFDKSGSMADAVGGVSKIEVARQSVLGALQAVPANDLFGVIAFDSRPVSIAPLSTNNDVSEITGRLRALEPNGSTSIAPAIDLAETWLRGSGVERRRVLLVSDGRTASADIERMRAAVRSREFELSVVAIGNDADRDLLASLATESGGRAYFPNDISDLPKIVARDATGGSTGTTVMEPFTARILRHAVTRGIDPSRPPTLAGYSVSAAKPGADVMISSHLSDPLLAGWRIGLGRVVVSTANLSSSGAFVSWPAFGQLWSQTVRWAGRQASASDAAVALDATLQGVEFRVTFEPATGSRRIVDAAASIRAPSGRLIVLPLSLISPGQLRGSVALADEGTYVASMTMRRADGSDDQTIRGVYWSPVAEKPAPPNRALLETIARTTGGRVLTGADSPFAGNRPGEPTDAGPLITHAALLAFLIDVARRRGLLQSWRRRSAVSAYSGQAAA